MPTTCAGRPGEQLPPVAAPAGAQTPNPPPPPGRVRRPGYAAAAGARQSAAGRHPAAGRRPAGRWRAARRRRTGDAAARSGGAGAAAAGGPAARRRQRRRRSSSRRRAREFRVGGGPYLTPMSINNASRVSTLSLTITYNPAVLRVRNVQEGTFMRQGDARRRRSRRRSTPWPAASTSPWPGSATRSAPRAPGLIASLFFDAVAPGDFADPGERRRDGAGRRRRSSCSSAR